MGIEVSLTVDGFGVRYRSWDVLTGKDLIEAHERLREEVRRKPDIRYLFVDHSAVTRQTIDTGSLRILAERSHEVLDLLPDGIVAIVAPKDVLFGLSRMWEMLADQPVLVSHVARTPAEAVAWLREQLAQRQLPCSLTG